MSTVLVLVVNEEGAPIVRRRQPDTSAPSRHSRGAT
jgi:hypothetical protein